MKRIRLTILFVFALLLALPPALLTAATGHAQTTTTIAQTAPPALEQEAGSTSAACLDDDPFRLAELVRVVSSPNPPTAPVSIGAHMTVQYMRQATMTEDALEELPVERPVRGAPQPSESENTATPLNAMPLRIFNVRTGHEFRVQTSEAMLKRIYACHAAAGLTEGNNPTPAGAEADMTADLPDFLYLPSIMQGPARTAALPAPRAAAAPAGWSNGTDTRVMRTPTTLWPWRAITQSSSWPDGEDSFCTMTLIGPRHLITAAHCLVAFGTSDWKSRKLTPGRNGIDVEPYGVSRMTPNPPPGEEAWYIVPDPWLDPNTPDDINKYQWDIGIVLMLDRLGDQTGWMGYGAYPASDLNQRNHLNRGYPRCMKDYSEEPAACPDDADDDTDAVARLYGDIGYCDIGEYHNPGSNGWNREFSFSCDLSRGHSGSPLYHYRYSATLDRNVPVVAAVVSWHECTTCEADDDYPNHARRITPWVRDLVSWLRETFP